MWQVSRQTYIEIMQPRPFEEWIEKGHQRDVNLCSAYARPTNERSFVRGRGGYNQGSFVYFVKACGDWWLTNSFVVLFLEPRRFHNGESQIYFQRKLQVCVFNLKKNIDLISRWMGLKLLQGVAHIFLNYFSMGRKEKSWGWNWLVKLGKDFEKIGPERNMSTFVTDSVLTLV